jgi:hypothetical protein
MWMYLLPLNSMLKMVKMTNVIYVHFTIIKNLNKEIVHRNKVRICVATITKLGVVFVHTYIIVNMLIFPDTLNPS